MGAALPRRSGSLFQRRLRRGVRSAARPGIRRLPAGATALAEPPGVPPNAIMKTGIRLVVPALFDLLLAVAFDASAARVVLVAGGGANTNTTAALKPTEARLSAPS